MSKFKTGTVRKNANKKIAALLELSTLIEYSHYGFDSFSDCYTYGDTQTKNAEYVLRFIEEQYGDVSLFLTCDENNNPKELTISAFRGYFTITFLPVEVEDDVKAEDDVKVEVNNNIDHVSGIALGNDQYNVLFYSNGSVLEIRRMTLEEFLEVNRIVTNITNGDFEEVRPGDYCRCHGYETGLYSHVKSGASFKCGRLPLREIDSEQS